MRNDRLLVRYGDVDAAYAEGPYRVGRLAYVVRVDVEGRVYAVEPEGREGAVMHERGEAVADRVAEYAVDFRCGFYLHSEASRVSVIISLARGEERLLYLLDVLAYLLDERVHALEASFVPYAPDELDGQSFIIYVPGEIEYVGFDE